MIGENGRMLADVPFVGAREQLIEFENAQARASTVRVLKIKRCPPVCDHGSVNMEAIFLWLGHGNPEQ